MHISKKSTPCGYPEVCGKVTCTCGGDIPESLALIAENERKARELSNAYRRRLRERKRQSVKVAVGLLALLLAQATPPPDASDTEWQRYCGLAYTLSHHNPNAPKPAPVMECKRRDAQS